MRGGGVKGLQEISRSLFTFRRVSHTVSSASLSARLPYSPVPATCDTLSINVGVRECRMPQVCSTDPDSLHSVFPQVI